VRFHLVFKTNYKRMKSRKFNRTGYCKPELHYMVDPFRGLYDEIQKLIKWQEYFAIHAPRQTGKTSLLHSLVDKINKDGEHISVVFSVETAAYKSISVKDADEKMCEALYDAATFFLDKEFLPDENTKKRSLKDYLVSWAKSQSKRIVLFIDEIDSLYDDVLVSTLRQLRDGFQSRPKHFPSSIALVGLRDVRDYKLKIRPVDGSLGSGSPFNIKAESFRLKSFTLKQVRDLLKQHTDEIGQVFTDEVSELIFDYTAGQPWLTNSMAYEITDKILKEDYTKEILPEHVHTAKENIIKRRDTHLDSLVDKLQDERVKPIIQAIISGEPLLADKYNDYLQYTIDLGIVSDTKAGIIISNKIYREIIPRVLNYTVQRSITDQQLSWYLKPDGKLNMDELLKEFQDFYRENSESWINRFSYKEAGQQLLLLFCFHKHILCIIPFNAIIPRNFR